MYRSLLHKFITLQVLNGIYKRCEEVRVEPSGHSWPEGNPSREIKLGRTYNKKIMYYYSRATWLRRRRVRWSRSRYRGGWTSRPKCARTPVSVYSSSSRAASWRRCTRGAHSPWCTPSSSSASSRRPGPATRRAMPRTMRARSRISEGYLRQK